ncbi:MAG TPA: porin family protein [Ohtaekwangia sp.]
MKLELEFRKRYLVVGAVLLSFVMIMLSTPYANAQNNTRGTAGIKGGLNISNLYSDDVDDKDARLGFHGGFYGQLVSSEAFALQAELLYSTRGNEVVSDGFIDQKTRFNLNYIDLPVLAVFKLGKAFEIHAGAYAGYLVGASIKTEGDLGDEFDELDRDNFKAFDYGLVGGVGFNFGSAQVGARYNLGLQEIAETDGAQAVLGDAKNSLGQVYLALRLNGE